MDRNIMKKVNDTLFGLKDLMIKLSTSSEPPATSQANVGRNPDKCLEPPVAPSPPPSSPGKPSLSSPSSPSAPSEHPRRMESNRPMKYPYTLTAKMMQFPLRYYVNNVWMWKYYFVAVGLTLPIFYKIGKLSYTPANVEKWNEVRKKEFGLIPHDH